MQEEKSNQWTQALKLTFLINSTLVISYLIQMKTMAVIKRNNRLMWMNFGEMVCTRNKNMSYLGTAETANWVYEWLYLCVHFNVIDVWERLLLLSSVCLKVSADRFERKSLFALAWTQTVTHREGQRKKGGGTEGKESVSFLSVRAKENKAHQRTQIPISGCFRTS